MTNLSNKQSRTVLCLGQNSPGIRLWLFFSDSTSDSSTSLSRAASEWKQASIVRGKATDFLVQKGRRSERGWVPPEGDPWNAGYQVPLSMGFSRQEYWSGLPMPSPHVLPSQTLS